MSMMTISGIALGSCRKACAASSQTQTHFIPCVLSINSINVSRIGTLSSTMAMVISAPESNGESVSGMFRVLVGFQWELDADDCAGVVRAHFKAAADTFRSLSHVVHSVSLRL